MILGKYDDRFAQLFELREEGKCVVCFADLPSRRRTYCSNECRDMAYSLLWQNLSFYHRQATGFRCEECGGHADIVHHVIPISLGGTSIWENLQTLCYKCHGEAHERSGTLKVLRRMKMEEVRRRDAERHHRPLESYWSG